SVSPLRLRDVGFNVEFWGRSAPNESNKSQFSPASSAKIAARLRAGRGGGAHYCPAFIPIPAKYRRNRTQPGGFSRDLGADRRFAVDPQGRRDRSARLAAVGKKALPTRMNG